MTLNITIGSDRASDEEDSSESGVEIAPPSITGSHASHDSHAEWADVPLPDELKPGKKAYKPPPRVQSRYWAAAPSPFRVSKQDDWLISSGDNDKDITAHLNLDVALDLEHELGYLARLNRLGHFKKGIRYFERRLAPYVDFFPVVAEYADLLLEQGNFGNLHQFISSRLKDHLVEYSKEEYILLKILKAFAEIYTKGAIVPALNMAKETLSHLSVRKHVSKVPSLSTGVKIQLLEMCVRIITNAAAYSNLLETESFNPLLYWSASSNGTVKLDDKGDSGEIHARGYRTPRQSPPRIGSWYRFLLQEGFSWDAHRILRSILPMLGSPDGHYIFNGRFEEFFELKNISEAEKVLLQPAEMSFQDEQVLLAEFANACLLADFLSAERFSEIVQVAGCQFLQRSRSLASAILLEYPHLISTRPYLDWLLSESIRILPFSRHVQPLVKNTRLVPDSWTWKSFDNMQFLHQRKLSMTRGTELPKTPNDPPSFQSLESISECVRGLGDYRLERSVLHQMFWHSLDWDQSLQALRDLTRLNRDLMSDTCGYLQSLIDECIAMDYSNAPDCERLREDLYSRFSAFDHSFPFRFDYDTAVHESSAIVFFDNALLKYIERNMLFDFLVETGRGTEAELVGMKLSRTGHYLPGEIRSSLISTGRYFGRTDSLAAKQIPKSAEIKGHIPDSTLAGYRVPDLVPGPSDVRRDGPGGIPRAILQVPYRSDAAADDTALSLERLIRQGRDAERAKQTGDLVEREKKAMKQERVRFTQEVARFRRHFQIEEEKKRVAQTDSTSLVTLKDPVGRAFLFPFNQCRPFAAMKGLMQQVFRSDNILAPHIAKGNYRFTSLDGNPITRDSWDSDIQPGGTIMVHITSDLGQDLSQEPEKANTEHDQPVEGERLTAQLESVNIVDPEDKQDQGPRVDDVSDSST
ncbi:hypothetical protein CBS147343_4415 [Aspergillus niger]|nr:hypothetical protein CBS133816_5012 [Aspergillus niger]KAI2858781.1 hypothetical protein CBS12448_5980 [Aspergillus niger]KAI2913196.1 hypothetical protein CBS147371_7040 [Aspergillus niger]KAI2960493.1 hypothetical protein CBS147322_458 [Aspergillus niger]KAI2984554.1 hypothetical protein CBS147344_6875 [Aspergillus niger]